MENIWQRRHPDDLQWTPNIVRGGALSSGSVVLDDLWSRKIWKPKMIVWSPVLHSSLDDHVLTEYACLFYNIGTLTWVIWKTEDTKIGKKKVKVLNCFKITPLDQYGRCAMSVHDKAPWPQVQPIAWRPSSRQERKSKISRLLKTLLEWLRRKIDKKFLLSLSLGTKTPCSTKE